MKVTTRVDLDITGSIEKMWSQFSVGLLPPGACPEQWQDMKVAFFSGIYVFMAALKAGKKEDVLNFLNRTEKEVAEFLEIINIKFELVDRNSN